MKRTDPVIIEVSVAGSAEKSDPAEGATNYGAATRRLHVAWWTAAQKWC